MAKYKGSDNGFYDGFTLNPNGPRKDTRNEAQKEADAKRRKALREIDKRNDERELGLDNWFGLP